MTRVRWPSADKARCLFSFAANSAPPVVSYPWLISRGSTPFRPSRNFFAAVGIISDRPSLNSYWTSDFRPWFSIVSLRLDDLRTANQPAYVVHGCKATVSFGGTLMLMPHWRKVLLCSCLFAAVAALGTGLARVAAKSATEAPAGFNTPSFNSAQSISNGIVEPPGDTFARDQQVYEKNETVADGLGPVYNATSCVVCHQNPNSGAASQITELRVGHNDANGNFVNPTIFINDGKDTITGRSIVNDRAIGPEAQEHIPATENIRTLRAALNTEVGSCRMVDSPRLSRGFDDVAVCRGQWSRCGNVENRCLVRVISGWDGRQASVELPIYVGPRGRSTESKNASAG